MDRIEKLMYNYGCLSSAAKIVIEMYEAGASQAHLSRSIEHLAKTLIETTKDTGIVAVRFESGKNLATEANKIVGSWHCKCGIGREVARNGNGLYCSTCGTSAPFSLT